jgi:hypothetical protein
MAGQLNITLPSTGNPVIAETFEKQVWISFEDAPEMP